MNTGIVEWFDTQKGYGFITGADGRNVFVHYRDIQADGYKTLMKGQSVQYDVEPAEKGPKAVNVTIKAE